jgi:glycosyltransferase involved in cell wall biosynthesis
MRVAFVHDWLVSYRGGEKVLEALMELYPDAPIYTLFHQPDAMPPTFQKRTIITPWASRWLNPIRKALLPFMPMMIERFPLEHYDLVISTSSCVAKGIIPAPQATHLCYIHSPMRYIWDQRDHYLSSLRRIPLINLLVDLLATQLRMWDVSSSPRVDQFVANSHFVAQRVQKYYGRGAKVIHPPIDIDSFLSPTADPELGEYILAAGAFVPYKRFDLALEACQRTGKKLVIAGSGPLTPDIQQQVGPNMILEIAPSRERWVQLFQHADAFLFPGVEDFGMTAIESMAAGTPVIAYQAGGALDFVKPGETGEFFAEPTASSLAATLEAFDKNQYSAEKLRAFARSFTKEQFLAKIKQEVGSLLEKQRVQS